MAPPKTEAKLALGLEAFGRMTEEIAQMGARTPHELMRCVEVASIRDCAELAARASLARTESRWGLYHDRADHPGRDDAEWFWHLNIRRGADGAPEFVKRAVAPYLVPVSEFDVPEREVTEVVLAASPAITPAASPGRSVTAGAPAAGKQPPRILELVRLAETQPPVSGLQPFLDDPDARVRRAAVAFLTETAAAEAGVPLAVAAADDSRAVRHAAAIGLRELASVLPASDLALVTALRARAASHDPVIRRAVLDVLGEMRAGDSPIFAGALTDADDQVRVAAVRGLASVADQHRIAQAAGDPAREVRVAVADGLAALAGDQGGDRAGGTEGRRTLERLAGDADPLVRAAGFKAAGARGCPPPLDSLAVAALAGDAAWQARAGAAQALGAASAEVAVPPLASAARDPHADVRKAAIIALVPMSSQPAAAAALRAATDDSDADVRAYARRANALTV